MAAKKIENMDHAFELSLILVTIISGILAQYVPTEVEINLPPVIASMRRVSIIFVFPMILTIFAWIVSCFVDSESLKMHLRSYSWSSIIFSGILGVIEFYVVCSPKGSPEWLHAVFLFILVIFGLMFPIIPIFFTWRILERYKMAYGTAWPFPYKEEMGKLGRLVRYCIFALPFVLSCGVFWLAFLWTTLV